MSDSNKSGGAGIKPVAQEAKGDRQGHSNMAEQTKTKQAPDSGQASTQRKD